MGAGGGRPPVTVSLCLLSSPDQWEKVWLGNEAVLDSGIWQPSYHRPRPPAAALWVRGCGWGFSCSCPSPNPLQLFSDPGKGTGYFGWAPGFQPGNMKWLSQGLAVGCARRTRAASAEGGPGWGGNSLAMEEVGRKRASEDRVGLSPV